MSFKERKKNKARKKTAIFLLCPTTFSSVPNVQVMGAAGDRGAGSPPGPALSPLLRGPRLPKCGFSPPPRMASLLPTPLSQDQARDELFPLPRPPFPHCHRLLSTDMALVTPANASRVDLRATLCLPQNTSPLGPSFFSSLPCQRAWQHAAIPPCQRHQFR